MRTNILTYLEETAERLPEKTAFANEKTKVTFAGALSAARSIGSALIRRGFSREPVVILMDRSPQMINAFWGVVYSGCFYVPMDEEMPRFRVSLIFGSLKPRAVICDEANSGLLEKMDYSGEVLLYGELAGEEEDPAALARVREAALDTDPVYIVFTSGSTGTPKGVVGCHRPVIDYVENLTEVLGIDETSVMGSQAPLYFDACLKDLFGSLVRGATTWLIPRELFMFPVRLVEYLNCHRINTVCWVASAFVLISSTDTFRTAKPEYLRTVVFGSEVFPIRQFRIWREALPEARFINLYGPTECTGMSCWYEVSRDFAEGEVIPIGRPFRNREILLVNDRGDRAAPGEPGEMYIRGAGVTPGYYGDPEKTAEAFVQNPLNRFYPETVYRTGDMAVRNERGELVFLSRRDHQIKHMGHRIELGEIEARVQELDGVGQAACVYDTERGRIVLFYTGTAEKGELILAMKDLLPRYMMPNRTNKLQQLPLTANGKIDRTGLGKIAGEKRRK